MRWVAAFGRFWWDFVIGDDWRIAAGVVVVLAAGAVLVRSGLSDTATALLAGAGILLVVVAAIVVGAARE